MWKLVCVKTLRTCLENVVGQASRPGIFAGETPVHRRPEARATILQTRSWKAPGSQKEIQTSGQPFWV